jgi:hypothetical protein
VLASEHMSRHIRYGQVGGNAIPMLCSLSGLLTYVFCWSQTTQLSKLQVGADSQSVKLIASTVAEIENLMPWLAECKREGKDVNVSQHASIAEHTTDHAIR